MGKRGWVWAIFVKLKSKLSLKVCCKLLLIENTSLFGNQMSCIFQNLLFCDIFGNDNEYGELNFSIATILGWYYSWSRRANGKIATVIIVMEAIKYLYCGEVCVKKIFTFSNGLCVCLWRFILTCGMECLSVASVVLSSFFILLTQETQNDHFSQQFFSTQEISE